MTTVEQPRCASCERYLPNDPDGYYDAEPGCSDFDHCLVVVYCDETCARRAHPERAAAPALEPSQFDVWT